MRTQRKHSAAQPVLTVLHSLCSTSCTACDSGWDHYDRAWRFTVLRNKKRACGCFATCVMNPVRYSLDQNNMELPVLHSLDHCECSSTPALSFASAKIAVPPSNGLRGRPSGLMRTRSKHSAAQPVLTVLHSLCFTTCTACDIG